MSPGLLRAIPDEVRGESDKAGAARIQAETADTLWDFDEAAARTLFRTAFETASSPIAESSDLDNEAKAKQMELSRRQAAALTEVIMMFAKRDRATAERWLDSIKAEQKKESPGSQLSQERAEFLAQLGYQLAKANPDEATRLGLMSLGSKEVPEAMGRLLIALRSVDRARSDNLFRGVISAMRGAVSPGRATLNSLSNYLFFNAGTLFQSSDAPLAQLFTDYLLDFAGIQVALAREARSGRNSIPQSAVDLTNFLAVAGLDIVSRNAPDKLMLLRSNFNELSSALTEEQRNDLAQMASGLRQPDSLEGQSDGADIDSQIQRAEHEKDPVLRDSLWRTLAGGMMWRDAERALAIASRIDDKATREQTQDDINLVLAGASIRSGTDESAHQIALKFNDVNLRARILAELADRIWKRSKRTERPAELLSEAYELAAKSDPTADRAAITLVLAEKFSKFDLERGFELVDAAIKTINQVQIAGGPPPSKLSRGPRIHVSHVIMVGSAELITGFPATLQSLSFQGLGDLVRSDYFRARNLADHLQNRVVRARYLIMLAQSFLTPNRPPSSATLPFMQ